MATPTPTAHPTGAGHLAAHLHDLAQRIPAHEIDRIWIFPTRRIARAFSTVIVVAAFQGDDERRRILTARYTDLVDRRGRVSTRADLAEHGAAPPDRIGRVIDGVLRRLDEELLSAPPRTFAVSGDAGRWADLLAACAAPDSTAPSLASRDPASNE